jgi:hypothetical protein
MFGTKVNFDEAFPTIEDITVEVKEAGYMLKRKSTSTYTKEYLVPSFECNNISCKQGGVSIERVLREMVRNKQAEREEIMSCKGHEGSPKGRRIGRACMNHFEITISINYKENQSSAN